MKNGISKNDIKRFRSFYEPVGECYEWKGGVNSTGRGIFWLNRKSEKAHRISWVIANGKIPDNMCVLHKCDNGVCVRIGHLFLGTRKDNTQDMLKKKRFVGNTKIDSLLAKGIADEYRRDKSVTMKILGKKYSICYSTVFKIVHQQRSQADHVTFR